MSDLMREQHAEAVMLGGPESCPFDCAACEAAMSEHNHPTACGHPVTCHDSHCFDDDRGITPLLGCHKCIPADVPDGCVHPWPHGDLPPF